MLDTRMGYSSPDEGLLSASIVGGRKKPRDGDVSLKVQCERRKNLLNQDRLTWYPNWKDLAEHFRPYRGRFMINDSWDQNKGYRRNWAIVDSTPLQAVNICQAGLMSGTASEARPWFTYELSDEDLMEAPGVKEWLAAATKIARDILGRSNFYQALNECFGEYPVFGIGALGREWPAPRKGEDDIPHFQPFTIGSYYISQDRHRRVNTWFRDFRWTVQQIVERFSIKQSDGSFDPREADTWANISRYVRGLWQQRQYDQWIPLVHGIEENPEYRPGAFGGAGMRFRSVYYERGGEPDKILANTARRGEEPSEDASKILRIRGFRDFPVFVFRWYTNSEDAYGRGPAMDALGDARALQLQQKRKAQAIDKHVDPPYVAHPSLRNQRTSQLPGDTTYVAPDGSNIGYQPSYIIKPELQWMGEDIKEIQSRVNAVLHADIFALFIQAERSQPGVQPDTAAEINAKQQEKLLMLGPVLGQMNFDLFNPLHDWFFAECLRHGKFPPLPEAMKKASIKVKYTSILAQAINAVTSQSIDQLTQYVMQVAQMEQLSGNPALDKFDHDKAIEEKAKAVNAPPQLIRSDAAVAQLRQARAEAQEKQAQQEAAAQAAQAAEAHAGAAQKLGATPAPGGQGNLLDMLAQSVGAGQTGG